jgi:glycosyltransferase involved in cell wall biosynthesis
MKFSIITPTYRRNDLLKRATSSLFAQTYPDWEMIIINDSPQDTTYADFESSINDPRIHYHKNTINKGVNASRNYALEKVSADSTWVIFLDDDDYLAPDALATFRELISLHGDTKWFVTNRAKKNGESMTQFPGDETYYSYAWSYLILKRCKGDATHCIETKLINHARARFSKYVKQGEEWFFFYQLGIHSRMFYSDHNSTISDGYDISHGLNFRKRTLGSRYEALAQLFYEASTKKILRSSLFVYLLLRAVKLIIP